jgi:hypothetical protein
MAGAPFFLFVARPQKPSSDVQMLRTQSQDVRRGGNVGLVVDKVGSRTSDPNLIDVLSTEVLK